MSAPKVKTLIEALEFYADSDNWISNEPYVSADVDADAGNIAIAAIRDSK